MHCHTRIAENNKYPPTVTVHLTVGSTQFDTSALTEELHAHLGGEIFQGRLILEKDCTPISYKYTVPMWETIVQIYVIKNSTTGDILTTTTWHADIGA